MLDQTARPNFIFMLTRNDRTVADAAAHLEIALTAGVRHIGFKDIGLDTHGLAGLTARIRAAGAISYLEVVSLGLKDEIRSIEAGVRLGAGGLGCAIGSGGGAGGCGADASDGRLSGAGV